MEQNTPKKSLGLIDATFLVAGSMIGSGIFIVSSDMAKDLGSSGWLLFTWILTGIITLFGALSYGELAAMFPQAGGQFVYIQKAFGSLPSFLYGWSVFMVIQTGVIAAVGVAFGKFTGVFFPVLNQEILSIGDVITVKYANLLGVFTIVLLTYINVRGVNYGKIIQFIFTSSKLFALMLLIIVGIVVGIKTGYFDQNFTDAWSASKTRAIEGTNWTLTEKLTGFGLMIVLSTTIINSLFSSDAWNNVTFIAGEIRHPEKNLPRSLFLGTFIVTILYVLANVAYLGLLRLKGVPVDPAIANTPAGILQGGMQFASEGRVGTAAAYMMFGDVAIYLMAALIMISTFGCNNGLIMAGGRLFYAMGKENLFFKKAGTLNKAGVPQAALWAQCTWAGLLCLSGSYGILIKFATFASMIFYIVTISGLFVLRKKMPEQPRPYKAFGYPLVPALYLVFAFLICVSLTVFTFQDTAFSILLILLGIPVYFIFFNRSTVQA
jgi:APA family basic amino acid/polyamine antiporter